jgi:isoleucyl-tRNA synthetase
LTSDEVKQYLATGKISVDGIELVEGDLTAQRYVELAANSSTDSAAAQYETNTNNDVVILLDVRLRPELEQEGLAREVVNRVQRLRKKAGLVPTDDVDVFYRFAEGVGAELTRIMAESEEVIVRVLKRMPQPDAERQQGKQVIIEEDQEVGDVTMTLTLVSA